jgi:hypothetical protein
MRLCAACGERPRSGTYSNCLDCLTPAQIQTRILRREQIRLRHQEKPDALGEQP